jgi:hypothetical protein
MSLERGSRAREPYPFPLLNELARAMREGVKDGAGSRYNLRATPSRRGRVDDEDQGAGAALFPDNVHVTVLGWEVELSEHSNYFHHGFFMVPLVASTFGHLHPDFLRFLWNFAHVDRNHPAQFDLYRTGEVRHCYCGTDDEETKIQKAIFLKLNFVTQG